MEQNNNHYEPSFIKQKNSFYTYGKEGKRAIGVFLPYRSGEIIKLFSDYPDDFKQPLKRSEIAWISFSVNDVYKDSKAVAEAFKFSPALVSSILAEKYSAYNDQDVELGIMLPSVKVKELEIEISPLLILIRKKLILTIHSQESNRLVRFSRYVDAFLRKIPRLLRWEDKLTIVLTRIINENNDRNFDYLREIEEYGDILSQRLMETKTPREELGQDIYKMKHALITYLNTLWATLDVINSLRYGDADLITNRKKLLESISNSASDVTRQIQLSEHMSEVLASGLEVLQSVYNNQLQILNNRMSLVMTWLTILGTAVLVPNTIATVMANSAFNLRPEDRWWYMTLIIISTILASLWAYFWVKRKVKLPPKVE